MKQCIECNTTTVKKPNKHWFAGPTCDRCYRRKKYNEVDSKKKKYEREYRLKNKDAINKKTAIYVNRRNATDIEFSIKRSIRRRLTEAVKNNQKAGSAVRDLGCSIEDFKVQIEVKFQPGMTWDNYGEWEFDHIKPLSLFNLSDKVQFLQACHHSNLQPLWAKDNRNKSDKYD